MSLKYIFIIVGEINFPMPADNLEHDSLSCLGMVKLVGIVPKNGTICPVVVKVTVEINQKPNDHQAG